MFFYQNLQQNQYLIKPIRQCRAKYKKLIHIMFLLKLRSIISLFSGFFVPPRRFD